MPNRDIAIIGAGPIGLEAALRAVSAGYFINVYEKGRAADHVRQWGHTRLFTPFGMNSTELGRQRLMQAGAELPANDAILTGDEWVDRYLLPLSRLPEIAESLREQTEITAVARSRFWKGDCIGSDDRAADPFRLHTGDSTTATDVMADIVLDCSGTFSQPNPAGAGGVAAPGEAVSFSPQNYQLPDITGRERDRFADRDVLVIGSGYSAATAIIALEKIAANVIWLARNGKREPIAMIENDPLPERRTVAEGANRLARDATDYLPRGYVAAIDRAEGKYIVDVELPEHERRRLVVDEVIVNTGFRPNRDLFGELQVHECYATGGPMNLAAQLLDSGNSDCLSQPQSTANTLRNPEPNFYILGSKSYGRNSHFLLQHGLAQIDTLFNEILAGE